MKLVQRLLWVTCWTAITSACTSQPPPPSENALVQARARLASEVALCSQKYNYDPNIIVGKPQMALAPNELSWRQCAYEAVRDYQKVNPELTPLYSSLLDEDNLMTNAMMHGQMTRSQREAKMLQLIAHIKAAENEQISKTRLAEEQKQEQTRNIYNMFRDFGLGG
jgi:hypothetical protein